MKVLVSRKKNSLSICIYKETSSYFLAFEPNRFETSVALYNTSSSKLVSSSVTQRNREKEEGGRVKLTQSQVSLYPVAVKVERNCELAKSVLSRDTTPFLFDVFASTLCISRSPRFSSPKKKTASTKRFPSRDREIDRDEAEIRAKRKEERRENGEINGSRLESRSRDRLKKSTTTRKEGDPSLAGFGLYRGTPIDLLAGRLCASSRRTSSLIEQADSLV